MSEDGLQRTNSRKRLSDLLGEETVKILQNRSNIMGWTAVLSCWLIIFAAMIMIVWAEEQTLFIAVPVITLSIILIGGRQLGLAILMHEASHRSLFKNTWLNDTFTDWLCARPIFLDITRYRKHHMVHHTRTGTADDIDLPLYKSFPVTRRSLVRKLIRDLTGISGIKNTTGLIMMYAGILKWTVSNNIEYLPAEGKTRSDHFIQFLKEAWPTLLTNLLLFSLTLAFGHAELFLIWIIAYLIPYPLFTRIRSLAEHAMTELTTDMLRNTRSAKAGWLARVSVAPYNVNYHIEHHVLISVPYWQLPRLHQLLLKAKVISDPPGYWQILKFVSSRTAKE